eukprot:EG_transcript_17206
MTAAGGDGGAEPRAFMDEAVCKEHLVAGVCLARLFEGTGVLSGRQRKGCPKIHDDMFRRQYIMAPNRCTFNYDTEFYERVAALVSIANDRCKAERKKAKSQPTLTQDVLCETCGLAVLPHMMEAHRASRTHNGYLELRRLLDERAGKDVGRDPKRQRPNSPIHEVTEFVRVRAPLVESAPPVVMSPTSEPTIMPASAGRAGELHNLRLLVRLLNAGQPVPDELYAAVNAHHSSPKAVLESRIAQLRREGVVEASQPSSSVAEPAQQESRTRRASRKETDYYNVVEDLTQSNARGFWVAPLPHHFTVNEASAIFSHFSGLQ